MPCRPSRRWATISRSAAPTSWRRPRGLPADVKTKLDGALKAAINSKPVQTFIARRKLVANYQGTEGLTAEVRAEAAAWAKVKAGLKKK